MTATTTNDKYNNDDDDNDDDDDDDDGNRVWAQDSDAGEVKIISVKSDRSSSFLRLDLFVRILVPCGVPDRRVTIAICPFGKYHRGYQITKNSFGQGW